MSATFVRIDGSPYACWWEERFGLPEGRFRDHVFFQRGRSTVWIASSGVELKDLTPVDAVGLPFLRVDSRTWKPTTVAAIAFGAESTRQVVGLSADEVTAFLASRTVEFAGDDCRRQLPNDGFVIVRHRGVPLGCGLWRGHALEPWVPKGRRISHLDQ